MNRKLAYLFILVSVLSLDCSRDMIKRDVRFTGCARDKFTQYPVINATIYLSQERGSFGGSTLYSDKEVGTTDATGYFDFKTDGVVKNEDCYARKFRFIGPGVNEYFYSGWFPLGDVDKRGENYVEAQLFTLARLRFYFVNATPFDQNDQVSDFYVERPWGQQGIEEGENFVITSTDANPDIWTSYYGYTMSVLHYTVTKNSISQQYTDTVYSPDPIYGSFITDTINY